MKDYNKIVLSGMHENFSLAVKPVEIPIEDGEIELSITQNGYQWSGFVLLHDQIQVVIDALTDHLKDYERNRN